MDAQEELAFLRSVAASQLQTIKALTLGCEKYGLTETTPVVRHLAAQDDEIERLRAELAALVNLRAEADSAWDSATYNAERARKAEAELAACREDAERYRWLREHWDDVNHPVDFIICNSFVTTLDADVDAARKGEGE